MSLVQVRRLRQPHARCERRSPLGDRHEARITDRRREDSSVERLRRMRAFSFFGVSFKRESNKPVEVVAYSVSFEDLEYLLYDVRVSPYSS